MPYVNIHVPSNEQIQAGHPVGNPLPHLLHTPAGLAILELQGTIHISEVSDVPQIEDSNVSQYTTIGRLVFPEYIEDDPSESKAWMKKVHFYVGRHQRLSGEVKELANPIAVLRRKASTETNAAGEELEIADIVYYKILFSSRPEPVSG